MSKKKSNEVCVPSIETINHYLVAKEIMETLEEKLVALKRVKDPEQYRERIDKIIEFIQKEKKRLETEDIKDVISTDDSDEIIMLSEFLRD